MDIPRILVVDDDPSILKFVQANLEVRGYKVFLAVDGEEALRCPYPHAQCNYLTKPFVLRELLDMVKTLLKGKLNQRCRIIITGL